MHESPRMRRLRNDLAALERLRSESSIFRFSTQGDPPHIYRIFLQGKGLWRDHGKIRTLDKHHVEIKLGSSYPRTLPEIRWLTPIYHPNISEIGMVCLGGYGTHWVPSVQLDELCIMLWDMLRYHNYDIRSPYNRDSALWVASQTAILFPTDSRPLRDLRAALGRVEGPMDHPSATASPPGANGSAKPSTAGATAEVKTPRDRVRSFVERYGRVFNNAPSGPERKQAGPQQDLAVQPAHPELEALVMAKTAPESAPHATNDEVLILENHSRPAAEHRPRPSWPASDDIVFIE